MLVLVGAAGVSAFLGMSFQNLALPLPGSVSSARLELLAVLGPIRPVEGRLTGFAHAPYGKSTSEVGGDRSFLSAALKIKKRAEARGSPIDLADKAVLMLTTNRLDDAAAGLEQAVLESQSDANLVSDLAALHLARARARQDPYDIFTSLDLADRAVSLNPALPEARFNRALALTRIGLVTEATKAWSDYLALDDDSAWSGEARQQLRELSKPQAAELWETQKKELRAAALAGQQQEVQRIVNRFPQFSRMYAEEELLSEWAELQPVENSDHLLSSARAIGESLVTLSGEAMLHDTVSAIESARGDTLRRAALARGHRAFRAGLDEIREENYRSALGKFSEARKWLVRGDSPFHLWAGAQVAVCRYYVQGNQPALDTLAEVRSAIDGRSYISLSGRVAWLEALVHYETGHSGAALAEYADAVRAYSKARERENLAAVQNLLATLYDYLGEARKSWWHRHQALKERAQVRSPRRLHNILDLTAEAALKLGEPRIALYFQDEAVETARRSGNALELAVGLWQRSRIHHELGSYPDAIGDIEEAKSYLDSIKDLELRRGVEADIDFSRGIVERAVDPRQATELLTEALELYRDTEYRFKFAKLYQERALAHLALGDDVRAEQDFEAAIEVHANQRREVGGELRISYFDQALDAFDHMIVFQAARRKQARALEYVERARAQALFDSVIAMDKFRDTRELSAEALARLLPRDTTFVVYTVLDDRLLIWQVRDGRIRLTERGIPQSLLAARVDALKSALKRGSEPTLRHQLADLYEILIAPIELSLVGERRLVIAPDKSLYQVPFNALVGGDGRFLVERYTASITPSLSFYLSCLRSQERSLPKPHRGSVLAVAVPDSPSAAAKGLRSLPNAPREAAAVCRHYPESEMLVGGAATAQAFLAALPKFDVVHFAGHSLVNSQAPSRSILLLGNELSAGELAGLKLDRTRLVVLASCGTAWGQLSNTEGPLSLSRPFLVAGVPAVIGSLWPVDDEASLHLFEVFHGHYAAGADAATALREAHLALLRSRHQRLSSPRQWSAFQLLGASAMPALDDSHN